MEVLYSAIFIHPTNPDLYYVYTACQCNGHSKCDGMNQCLNCTDNTAGDHCERCADGYYGDTTNGGSCQCEYTSLNAPTPNQGS